MVKDIRTRAGLQAEAIVMALQWVEQMKPLRVTVFPLSAEENVKSGTVSKRYDLVCEILVLLQV